jgi:iron complex transport system substrate-binding protein
MMKQSKYWVPVAILLGLVFWMVAPAGAGEKPYRTVVDSRGVSVKVPKETRRVVTISDGLIEGVVIVLGEQEKLVGVGSSCVQDIDKYTYPTVSGGEISYMDGMNPVTYLHPRIRNLPLVANWNMALSYETLAGLEPDVMIVRVGSCWLFENDEQVPRTIQTIESLDVPLVVLRSPNTYDKPNMSVLSDEIRLIGRVFDKETRADKLAKYLESQVEIVKERTKDIPEGEKPRVLLFGLSPVAREGGGAGDVLSTDTIESFFLEELVNARNAFRETGGWKIMSAEQVLALDPDVIVLPTDWGFHPPRELYEAPYYQNLQEIKAIKNRRVAALPWTPCNCDKRLEYPIDVMVMAKAAYPDRFADIKLDAWLLDFYQNVYGVDQETAKKLRSIQWMDWTLTE